MNCGTGLFVHLNQLKENWDRKKLIGNPKLVDVQPNAILWKIDKPAWELTTEEYNNLLKTKPTWLLKDYEKFSTKP